MNSFNTHDDTQKVDTPFINVYLKRKLWKFGLTWMHNDLSLEDCWEVLQLQHRHSHFQPGIKLLLHLFLQLWSILHHYRCKLIRICSQSQYPRIVTEDFLPLPSKKQAGKDGWLVVSNHSVIIITLQWPDNNLFGLWHFRYTTFALLCFLSDCS